MLNLFKLRKQNGDYGWIITLSIFKFPDYRRSYIFSCKIHTQNLIPVGPVAKTLGYYQDKLVTAICLIFCHCRGNVQHGLHSCERQPYNT